MRVSSRPCLSVAPFPHWAGPRCRDFRLALLVWPTRDVAPGEEVTRCRLPLGLADFSSYGFWEASYREAAETHEWYTEAGAMSRLLQAMTRLAPPPPPPSTPTGNDTTTGGLAATSPTANPTSNPTAGPWVARRAMVAGCGNSSLGYEMWAQAGYPMVDNVDYVPEVVRLMDERYGMYGTDLGGDNGGGVTNDGVGAGGGVGGVGDNGGGPGLGAAHRAPRGDAAAAAAVGVAAESAAAARGPERCSGGFPSSASDGDSSCGGGGFGGRSCGGGSSSSRSESSGSLHAAQGVEGAEATDGSGGSSVSGGSCCCCGGGGGDSSHGGGQAVALPSEASVEPRMRCHCCGDTPAAAVKPPPPPLPPQCQSRRRRHGGAVRWLVGDLTDMAGAPDGLYDLVVDKATLDALMSPSPASLVPEDGSSGRSGSTRGGGGGCASGGGSGGCGSVKWRSSAAELRVVYQYLSEMHRITGAHGRLLLLTLRTPGAIHDIIQGAASVIASGITSSPPTPVPMQPLCPADPWVVGHHEAFSGGRDGQALPVHLYVLKKGGV